MTIKTKLSLGLGFLFAVILLLVGLGIVYLNRLSGNSSHILKDNYESLVYAKNMLKLIDDGQLITDSAAFEKQLILQESNITEVGEKELTNELRAQFEKLKAGSLTGSNDFSAIRKLLFQVTEINLQTIILKNERANHSAKEAIVYMTVICTVTILITLTFIISFPGYIANPIRTLTESIKEITRKNYEQRIHFKSNDEFGELASAFNEMASKLDEYEHSNLAEIMFQKKRIETIINNMYDPLIVLDENNNVLFANTQSVNILGVNAGDILNRYAPDVALNNDLFRTIINNEKSTQPLKIFAGQKESYFTKEKIEIHTDGKLIGQVFILKNVTDFKELDAAKTNFIATISHELKTPIASIQMCSQLLADNRVGGLNDEQKDILKTVNEETQRLLKITGELLDLAQVETGNISLEYHAVHPGEIVDFAYNALKFQAEQKHIAIEIQSMESLQTEKDLLVNVDLEKTAWVMINFLSNAIRYSPENGKVIINVAKEDGKLIFSVQDFGRGIDAKHKDKIFGKFYKIPGSDATKTGTGLGLAISKEFITAQGGEIWVESEAGKGCKFCFSIRLTVG